MFASYVVGILGVLIKIEDNEIADLGHFPLSGC